MAVLKVIEILAESNSSWEDATKNAVSKAAKSVNNIRSAYVKEQTVTTRNGEVDAYRVNVKITFEVES